MINAVIDRLTENGKAILLLQDIEEERIVDQSMLPPGSGAGSHVTVELLNGAIIVIHPDEASTEAAQQRVSQKMNRLREKKQMRRSK